VRVSSGVVQLVIAAGAAAAVALPAVGVPAELSDAISDRDRHAEAAVARMAVEKNAMRLMRMVPLEACERCGRMSRVSRRTPGRARPVPGAALGSRLSALGWAAEDRGSLRE
jgi:hypothetical protein